MSTKPDRNISAFAGCSRMLEQYRTVGAELVNFENLAGNYVRSSEAALTAFRCGVSTVGLEVLDSYLEDLLSPDCPDEMLFIRREGFSLRSIYSYIALLGSLFAVGMGIYATSSGASFGVSFGLTIALALPFAVLWHWAPRAGLARRMEFAQLVSQEIARRRGSDSDEHATARLSFGELLQQKKIHGLPGAAFSIVNLD